MAGKKLVQILSDQEIFNIHERVLTRDGGLAGLRGDASLESITQRVHNHALFDPDYHDPVRLSALLAYAIVVGHPFNDANKRTAFVACLTMLQLNGYALRDGQWLAELLVVVAAGRLEQSVFIDDVVNAVSARTNP